MSDFSDFSAQELSVSAVTFEQSIDIPPLVKPRVVNDD
jgi:hypothetical protein